MNQKRQEPLELRAKMMMNKNKNSVSVLNKTQDCQS